MATKLAKLGALANMPHTNGIYSDMTVDGPEIGTLVMVVDRAKNLPNLKKMSKQDPYCAARLGKEARKTDTDKRGGQTPRWDQELRFTVHDSPDYYKMKVSVFNDDKKTDIIGETWVNLENVVVPGGGQSDTWHGLTCKGKYAGEIRLELTYYDTRQATIEATAASERKRHSAHHGHGHALGGPREHAPVKRRPLPTTATTSVSAPPIIIPSDPAAAPAPERVPRGFQTPPQTSAPFSPDDFNSYSQPIVDEMGYGYPVQPVGHPSPYSRRGSMAPPHALRSSQEIRARRQSHLEMPHAHSAPIIPHYHHDPDVGMDRLTQYPPELPPLDGYDYDEPQFAPYGAAYRNLQPTVEDEDDAAPPPPPAHRASAPAVPGVTLPSEYPPETAMVPQSPHFLQDPYAYPPEDAIRPPSSGDPYAIPSALVPGSTRAAHHHRMSISAYPSSGGYSPTSYPAEYQPPQWPTQSPIEYSTPPNYPPHPMSHAEFAPAYYPTAPPEPMPLARRPVSPGVSPSRNSRIAIRSTPNRKSVSPRPQTSDGASRNHFSPDSFEVLNPAARNSMYNLHGSNPHSPYTIERPPTAPSPVPTNQSRDLDLHARDEDGNIVTMDGRKIDPSDHLPVDSWAPEPEPKGKDREKRTPVRDSRLTGAREPGAVPRHYGPGDASPTAMVRSSRYSKRAPGAYGAPPIPAKVPFGDGRGSMDGGDMTALSEELRGIELGPAGTGRERGRWRIRIGRV